MKQNGGKKKVKKMQRQYLFSLGLINRVDLGLRGNTFNTWEIIFFFTAFHPHFGFPGIELETVDFPLLQLLKWKK